MPPKAPLASIAVRSRVMPLTRSVPRISTGLSQNRTISRRACPEAGAGLGGLALRPSGDGDQVAADPPVGLGQRGASPEASNAVRSASSACTTISTPGSSPSSRSSLVVNLAYAGPRRPIMWTSRTLLACRASRTGCGTSVACSSAGSRARIRATSTATLPTPMTATDSASRVNAAGIHVGVAAVPVHEVGGGVAAGQVLAGDAEPPVAHGPGGVDHRVVGGHQLVAGDVLAEVDPAQEADVRAFQHLAQVLRDGLYRLVVRRHAVADQAVRGGQPVDHVYSYPDGQRQRRGLLDQRLGGVQPGRSRADHGDVKHDSLRYSTGRGSAARPGGWTPSRTSADRGPPPR